jgi:microcystin degradation protein MlrC
VVVKSSQHFHDDFAPIAQRVLYVDTPGLLRNDLENMPYRQRDLNYWPRSANPWEAGA